MPRKARQDDRREMDRQIGDRIREARAKAQLSQIQIVNALGFTVGWLSDIEQGRNSIYAADLQRVADILEYPIAYFTEPDYTVRGRHTPNTRLDWELLFPGEPARANAHIELDRLFRRPPGGSAPSPSAAY